MRACWLLLRARLEVVDKLQFDIGRVNRHGWTTRLPISQSDVYQSFHGSSDRGRGVVALSAAHQFATSPRRPPPPCPLPIAIAKNLKAKKPGTLNYTCVKRPRNWRRLAPFQDRSERALLVSINHREVTSLWSVETRSAHSERSRNGAKHLQEVKTTKGVP